MLDWTLESEPVAEDEVCSRTMCTMPQIAKERVHEINHRVHHEHVYYFSPLTVPVLLVQCDASLLYPTFACTFMIHIDMFFHVSSMSFYYKSNYMMNIDNEHLFMCALLSIFFPRRSPTRQDEEFRSPESRRQVRCKVFLAYTSNLISAGTREVIRFLAEHKCAVPERWGDRPLTWLCCKNWQEM